MKLLIMQSSPTPHYFLLLLYSTLFSNTLNLCFSLKVIDQVSHRYKTTGKILVSDKEVLPVLS
jgi:hypothetical protein